MSTDNQYQQYALRRIRKQNPHLEHVKTWDEFMKVPMNEVALETINELLEAQMITKGV